MSVRAGAAWAANDLRPGLLDLPLTAWRVLTRRVLGKGAARS
jgi:predicted ATP-grasp superfamily ATP-dependent carboligase